MRRLKTARTGDALQAMGTVWLVRNERGCSPEAEYIEEEVEVAEQPRGGNTRARN